MPGGGGSGVRRLELTKHEKGKKGKGKKVFRMPGNKKSMKHKP